MRYSKIEGGTVGQLIALPKLLLFSSILLLSCSNAERKSNPDDNAIKEAVIALHQGAISALNKGDLQNLMSVYTDDVISMPPNQSPRVGKQSVQEMWENTLSTYSVHVVVKPEEVQSSGDLAFERGTYEMTLTPRTGGQLIEDTGKYLDILELQQEGNWKYLRVSWSSNR